jgi:small subunit ribosomal protein S8
MMTDPIADMLTRIRNATRIHDHKVSMPASRIRVGIAEVLKSEGYIDAYEVTEGKPSSTLEIKLRYGIDGEDVIRHIERISKPGRRVYASVSELYPVLRGQGIHILSTPRGIVSDRKAREFNVGGEVLAKLF